jgi:hypothetical protein
VSQEQIQLSHPANDSQDSGLPLPVTKKHWVRIRVGMDGKELLNVMNITDQDGSSRSHRLGLDLLAKLLP